MTSENELIEVVMKKTMTYKKYKEIYQLTKKKGWSIQAYQIGFHCDNLKIEK